MEDKNLNRTALRIIDEVGKVIIGKDDVIRLIVIAMIAGGHVLIEDVPGVGKTTLSAAIAKAAGLAVKRAQFTPDVMASDITGFNIYDKNKGEFVYRQGLVITNILLADEINRTSPKTQSALLEAMEERRVTVDSKGYKLPSPFMVVATQNETGYIGTYPLPEAQLDRFMMKLTMGYPAPEQETAILMSKVAKAGDDEREAVAAVCDSADVREMTSAVFRIHAAESVCAYITDIVTATRTHSCAELGASPRGGLSLLRAAQGHAFMEGRDYVLPEDVLTLALPVLSHRVIPTREARSKDITGATIVRDAASSVKAPFFKK
ncbi:ATPase [Clostridia bacterium]|nr:ATPase [Clostridia bacterium]